MISAAVLTLTGIGQASADPTDPEVRQPVLGARVKDVIEVDGYRFKDLNDNGVLDAYEDWRLAADARTADLIGRMTLPEKAGLMLIDTLNAGCESGIRGTVPAQGSDYINNQFMHLFIFRNVVAGPDDAVCGPPSSGFRATTVVTPEEAANFTNAVQEMSEATRLGIPSLFKSNARNHIDPNARAGINESAGAFTAFPKEAGIAAAALGAQAAATGSDPTIGDMTSVAEFADIMGDEWAAIGLRGMYGYMADLSTEPRWYRTHETFTEDPDLNANIMRTLVSELQGPVASDGLAVSTGTRVALTLKHFPGGGPQQLGLDPHYAFGKGQVYPAGMFGEHLKPFQAAIEAGVSSIMPYYGVPVGVTYDGETYPETGMAFSDAIVNGLLRDSLGFPGYVNSDTGIINDRAWGLEDKTVPERVATAINGGTDTLSGFHDVQVILDLVDDGLITPERVSEAAGRILEQFFRMGLFENPYVDPAAANDVVGAAAHRQAGVEMQRQSLVLLQNENTPAGPVLPLRSGSKVYVIGGIDADAVEAHGYTVTSGDVSDGETRPSAADNDYAVISLTANAGGPDYVSNSATSGLDPAHGINPAEIDGIPGYDGESLWGAADVCSWDPGTTCTDNGLVFGGAYPWESSILDFTGMDAASSWKVTPSLETVRQVIAEVGDPSKVILDIYFRQPYVLDEASGLRDVGAIVADFGTSTTALFDVLSGDHAPQGRMPFALAGTAEAILEQDSDRPGYDETTDGALYPFGFGLTYPEAGNPNLTLLPEITGPIPEGPGNPMWSSMSRARTPFDVADYGYVEEEYFLAGSAGIYEVSDDTVAARDEAPYVNNILVRRPANAADFSGVVLVDILNASNGFPGEDHWRRMWQWAMEEGHAVIGLTSKPIQIDALHNYNPARYAALTWDVDPSIHRDPIIADPDNPGAFNPHMVVPGAEEGLVWDITTQLGVALNHDGGARILGGQQATTTLLMGQSQSGIYLRTYVDRFHEAQAVANGGSLWDGYLITAGGNSERKLTQTSGLDLIPAEPIDLDVPLIAVSAEGDASLFGIGQLAKRTLPRNNYEWQVPGTPHTDLLSSVIPADTEIYKAGRLPNLNVHDKAFRDSLNIYPLEPAIIGAAQALISHDRDGTAPAASIWFDVQDGQFHRDKMGNVTGGLRYGLMAYPLGQYLGSSKPGSVSGSMALISADEFQRTYGTRKAYLAQMHQVDEGLIRAGYLTDWGAGYLDKVANTLLDRIGVPTDGTTKPPVNPGLPGTGVANGTGTQSPMSWVPLAVLLGLGAAAVASRSVQVS